MQHPTRVMRQPLVGCGMLVGSKAFADGVDEFARWHGDIDRVGEADEFLCR